jgi:hypothetical protein
VTRPPETSSVETMRGGPSSSAMTNAPGRPLCPAGCVRDHSDCDVGETRRFVQLKKPVMQNGGWCYRPVQHALAGQHSQQGRRWLFAGQHGLPLYAARPRLVGVGVGGVRAGGQHCPRVLFGVQRRTVDTDLA